MVRNKRLTGSWAQGRVFENRWGQRPQQSHLKVHSQGLFSASPDPQWFSFQALRLWVGGWGGREVGGRTLRRTPKRCQKADRVKQDETHALNPFSSNSQLGSTTPGQSPVSFHFFVKKKKTFRSHIWQIPASTPRLTSTQSDFPPLSSGPPWLLLNTWELHAVVCLGTCGFFFPGNTSNAFAHSLSKRCSFCSEVGSDHPLPLAYLLSYTHTVPSGIFLGHPRCVLVFTQRQARLRKEEATGKMRSPKQIQLEPGQPKREEFVLDMGKITQEEMQKVWVSY